jgi:integrase
VLVPEPAQTLAEITESTLLDYVRHQLSQQPTAYTTNRNSSPDGDSVRVPIPLRARDPFRPFPVPTPMVNPLPSRLWPPPSCHRLRTPTPATPSRNPAPHYNQVTKFWASFRTFRQLAVVGLMLLDGLRSCEILALQLEDLKLADALLHVLGKGKKQRTLPLPGEIMEVLQSYLRLERPLTNSPYLFVSLKGHQRGQPMTPAGLRSLFRHHR